MPCMRAGCRRRETYGDRGCRKSDDIKFSAVENLNVGVVCEGRKDGGRAREGSLLYAADSSIDSSGRWVGDQNVTRRLTLLGTAKKVRYLPISASRMLLLELDKPNGTQRSHRYTRYSAKLSPD